ncbi:hypothetical protein [Pseudonocardia sp. TRM90224]|uniref:hypothetical protein n=1 Tax=Pseudonocardia sp. TRM90224 TaxID=2812678 RepID=UPI001E63D302|nr:hypothetical protein [Pseudonocardia sp. TRM90224]
MTDVDALERMRAMLAADDYRMDITHGGDTVRVRITAGPQACDDCLVPKAMMRSMLAPALGVEPGSIELRYPTEETP